MENYLNKNLALVDNSASRISVCLCLDFSVFDLLVCRTDVSID